MCYNIYKAYSMDKSHGMDMLLLHDLLAALYPSVHSHGASIAVINGLSKVFSKKCFLTPEKKKKKKKKNTDTEKV